ncbi:MAG: hypothetical protein ACOYT4_04310 [Nanoarchaeota archaeon]
MKQKDNSTLKKLKNYLLVGLGMGIGILGYQNYEILIKDKYRETYPVKLGDIIRYRGNNFLLEKNTQNNLPKLSLVMINRKGQLEKILDPEDFSEEARQLKKLRDETEGPIYLVGYSHNSGSPNPFTIYGVMKKVDPKLLY